MSLSSTDYEPGKVADDATDSTSVIPTITASQFSTALALRPNLIAWFLGAGASAASGIPTGYAMIRDFKAQIFCRENNLSKREVDTGDKVWTDRIDDFFRKTALLPPDGDPTEYAAAFEAVHPEPRQRRQYVDDAIARGVASFGHRVLGSLIAARKVDCVFTTNFDPLVEESTLSASDLLPGATRARPTVAAIDSADRAMRCLSESDWPLIAKLHGDYQSISIKNTSSELKEQDERMRHVLVESSKRFGMLFVGYSGRDDSVMEALASVLEEPSPFPNGLYWITSSAARLLPAVNQFLLQAKASGVDVAVVECKTFDELAAEIIKQLDMPEPLLEHIMRLRPEPKLVPVKVSETEARSFPVLRYSALLVESLPTEARRITLSKAATTPVIRKLLKEQNCRAIVAAHGRELAVFGDDADVMSALSPLGPTLAGKIELDPSRDSWAHGLLYDGLVRALSRRRPLLSRLRQSGHSLIVASLRANDPPDRSKQRDQELARLRRAYEGALTGKVPTLNLPFHEGVQLKLEQINGVWWCGFEPYTFVDTPRQALNQDPAEVDSAGSKPDDLNEAPARQARDPAADWRRERWAQKYNKQWAAIIDAWAALLTPSNGGAVRALGLRDEGGLDAVFAISPITGWSRPGHHHAYFERNR